MSDLDALLALRVVALGCVLGLWLVVESMIHNKPRLAWPAMVAIVVLLAVGLVASILYMPMVTP